MCGHLKGDPGSTGSYLRDHWRGQHSLAISFWLNFILPGIAIHQLDAFVHRLLIDCPQTQFYIMLARFAVFWFVIYPWQATGVLRACERALAEYRNVVWARAAQAITLLGIVALFVDGLNLIQSGYQLSPKENDPSKILTDKPRDYSLMLVNDGTVIHLQGFLDFGVTRELTELLAHHPGVKGIILDSMGGPVYEGRGLAKLIKKHNLITATLTGCSSACTTAFIGGSRRLLGASAKLGFHQYRLEAKNILPFLDINEEQKKDLQFYESQAIDTVFLAQVFARPYQEMWFPSQEELLQAGVIHEVVDSTMINELISGVQTGSE